MTTVDVSGLRDTTNRLARKNKELVKQNERLVRMVLLERLKDGDIDFSEGLDLLDHFRPPFDDGDGYDLRFSSAAIDSWPAARKVPA
jgi:hypothetical protein